MGTSKKMDELTPLDGIWSPNIHRRACEPFEGFVVSRGRLGKYSLLWEVGRLISSRRLGDCSLLWNVGRLSWGRSHSILTPTPRKFLGLVGGGGPWGSWGCPVGGFQVPQHTYLKRSPYGADHFKHTSAGFLEIFTQWGSRPRSNLWGGGGHEATETGFAYALVSQAHGHNHIVQCHACCTAA